MSWERTFQKPMPFRKQWSNHKAKKSYKTKIQLFYFDMHSFRLDLPAWILATEVDCWSQMEVIGRFSWRSYSPCLKNSSHTFRLHLWEISQGLVGFDISAHFSAICNIKCLSLFSFKFIVPVSKLSWKRIWNSNYTKHSATIKNNLWNFASKVAIFLVELLIRKKWKTSNKIISGWIYVLFFAF